MEKKLYWNLTSNADIAFISHNLEDVFNELKNDFESDSDKNLQYEITPLYLTDSEFEELTNQ